MRKTILGLGLAISVCVSAYANLTVDDFTSGAYSVSITAGTDVNTQSGTMLGSSRRTTLQVISNPLNRPVVLDIGSGLSVHDNGSLAQSSLTLEYLLGSGSANLSGYDRLRIRFVSNDLPLVASVYFGSSSGQATGTFSIAPGAGFDYDVLFSTLSITGTMDWSNVNMIAVKFNTSPNGDYVLGQLQIVPEPASLIALATGVVSLVGYARRRK